MAALPPADNLSAVILNPPITPDPVAFIFVAVRSPLISAFEAVIAPLFVTLNSLEEIKISFSTDDADIAKRFPDDNLDGSSKNPPIEPLDACILVAFKSPDNLASDAVICPLLFNLNAPFEDDIAKAFIVKPPMIPDPVATIFVAVRSPSISAADAVI